MGKFNQLTTLSGDFTESGYISAVVAANADEQPVFTNKTGNTLKLISAGFVPDAAVTGAATNHFTLQVRNKGTAGTGTTGMTDAKAYDTGIDIAAFDEDLLVNSSTAANLLLADGETAALDKAKIGTGLDMPAGRCVLVFEHV